MSSEIERLDAELAGNVIKAQFETLRQSHVRWLGEGYDSIAFDVDGEWVFRFPKRSDVEQQLLLEMRLLPVLASESPLPVPVYSFEGAPSRLFPRHFGGYRKLPGAPAIGRDPAATPFDRSARSMATFLSWLHSYPTDRAAQLGVPRADSSIEDTRAEALEDVEHVAAVAPELNVEGWRDFLKQAPASGGDSKVAARLVHGDLAAEHILCDSGTESITGIIDWSDVAIGDPSVDLAGIFHWGDERFLDAVLSTYGGPADETTLGRARYRAACRGIGDIVFGVETGRAEYVAAGVRALNFSVPPGAARP